MRRSNLSRETKNVRVERGQTNDQLADYIRLIHTLTDSAYEYSVDNQQADAGQDGQTRLARLNSQARAGTGKCLISLFS